jgi:DNA repair exonuclease SbcCD ATPase subunit
MPDTLTDTTAPDGVEAPAEAEAPAAVPATTDELAQFKSRNSGLNAKVTTLEQERDQLRADLANARQGLTDKESGDADLRRQLEEANAALATAQKAAALADLKGSYPEAFSELGDGALSLTPEKLASLEARLTAARDEGEPETPKPVGNNQQRTTTEKTIEEMTSKELQAYMRTRPRSDMGLGD